MTDTKPLPMALRCDRCGFPHVDVGRWETTPHHTHLCIACGATFRPYDQPPFDRPSVGVLFADFYTLDDEEAESLSAARIRQMHETYDKLNEKRIQSLRGSRELPAEQPLYTVESEQPANTSRWARQRAELLEARIELPHFPVPTHVQVFEHAVLGVPRQFWPLAVRCKLMVRDLRTGEPVPIQRDLMVPEHTELSHLKEIVRSVLAEMLAHEVEEALVINGQHVFDPHGTRRLENP